MNIDEISNYYCRGLVLHAIELIEVETGHGASELEIDQRIKRMSLDEIVNSAAIAVLMMREARKSEIPPTEIDSETLVDEISDFLSEQDD